MAKQPNVILVFGDQWRSQATGYGGDPNVYTPHLDRLASQSVNMTHAVSGCPVCSPARACLLTGQYPLTHGVFVNDVPLSDRAVSLAQAFSNGGYETAYIGKWHVDGQGRSNYIPPERRQGFDEWQVLECTHDYNESFYYAGDSPEKLTWEGYDAFSQTKAAQQYVRSRRDKTSPFLMVLSWGPPHNPYHTAPDEYRARYEAEQVELRGNVPDSEAQNARERLAGYYAHCTALDDCVGDLLQTLDEEGIAHDTVFLFFSDHGDMVGSRGVYNKQRPWDESIRVPFLLRYPALFGDEGRQLDGRIDIPDIMPTLLGLCGQAIPDTVEGLDFSGHLKGGDDPSDGAALLQCPHPFGQWWVGDGGRSYRGLRTRQHTYVRALEGPWLLYDNDADPYQLTNLVGGAGHEALLKDMDERLTARLAAREDQFLPSGTYLSKWGYEVNARGTVNYTN
ncbi:MAG TPA: sulfatase [Candidatus Latescibacteria bacterium]|jgi:arylsulfatase A-like enzyme|nr:sulfatase [Gemmatimonadota bacterium]MDP7365152.1 sulfatase [Candidatus Latescibacterota bacterium]MDP7633880.1 sulfatase [Candidatus Latescibacterota bacterium]HJN29566.1 sulfatase [Candidatus Latescibacterota bacterium]